MKRKPAKAEIQNFEASLEKLKSIVSQLENGKLTLSESLQRYEEGIKFLTECHAALNSAQMKIEQLVKLDEHGRLVTKPFDDTASFDPSSSGKSSPTSGPATSERYSKNKDSVSKKGTTLNRKPPLPELDTDDLDPQELCDPDEILDQENLAADSQDSTDLETDFSAPDRSSESLLPPSVPPAAQRGFLDFDKES